MLRLRRSILTHLLSSSFFPCPSNSSLHRHLSATATPRISPNPSFAVGDYLVDTCGLTPAQAIKASAKLSHLKSPSKPEAVLAFLAGLGVSSADVAAAVVKDPLLLCAGVDTILAPNVAELTDLGLSRPDIVHLLSLARERFRYRSIVSKLRYYLPIFGSFGNLFRAFEKNAYLVTCNLDKVAQPNVVLLRECVLSDCDIAKLSLNLPRLLTTKPEHVRAMVACAEGLGVPRGSGMFRQALQAVAFLSKEKIATKVDHLKNTFMWSDAEVAIVVCKAPMVLRRSKESLQHMFDFLISEVGLETAYIARHPFLFLCSLEGRIRPRHYIVKFLKENGLLRRDWNYGSIIRLSEKLFMEKFICPHKEVAPHLAEDYAAACRGEMSARLICAQTKNLL